jgi:hypothetical protein
MQLPQLLKLPSATTRLLKQEFSPASVVGGVAWQVPYAVASAGVQPMPGFAWLKTDVGGTKPAGRVVGGVVQLPPAAVVLPLLLPLIVPDVVTPLVVPEVDTVLVVDELPVPEPALQRPAACAFIRLVAQFAVTFAVAIVWHAETEVAGSSGQHASSVAHEPVGVDEVLVLLDPDGELELHACAVMAAMKTTGRAKSERLRFMGGHHTRAFDRVKNDQAF